MSLEKLLKTTQNSRLNRAFTGKPLSECKLSREDPSILLSDIKSFKLYWLWENRIPRGKLTVLEGDPGLGKSLITLDLAARLSTSAPMPDGTEGSYGRILLIAPEDGAADTIKPRIEAAGGDPSEIRLLNRVNVIDPVTGETLPLPFNLSEHFSKLGEIIMQTRPALVIIDPLMAVFGPGINVSNEQQVRSILSSLAGLAQGTMCAILIVRHLNRGKSDNPFYRGNGPIGIIASARSGLLVIQHPSDEHKRLLVSIKNNFSEKVSHLAYQIVANAEGIPSIQWLGTNDYDVRSLLGENSNLSLQRQEILKVLQATDHPLGPKELAEETDQNYTHLRQLLRRMLNAGDIISPSRGLYTSPQPSHTATSSQHEPATSTTTATPTTMSQPDSTPVSSPTSTSTTSTTTATMSHPDSNPVSPSVPTPATVSHPDSNLASLSSTTPATSTTFTTSTTMSHPDSDFASTPTTPATSTTSATSTTMSHSNSDFASTPPLPANDPPVLETPSTASPPPLPTDQPTPSAHISFDTAIEQLKHLLHCLHKNHYLDWTFTSEKIGCPICDCWIRRDAAPHPATLALYETLDRYPPHAGESRRSWMERIAPSFLNLRLC